MTRVLITGANRGIGLELTARYAAAGAQVIAGVRDLGRTDDLKALAGQVSIEQIDMASPDSISAAAKRLGGDAIDIVINNAGSTGGTRQGIDDLDLAAWHDALDVNTIGPTLVAAHFKPNLVASGKGKLMTITSQLAASTWPLGGSLIYASTKAAVSKVHQALAIDWKDEPVIVTLMHPGWVQTDMGGPNAQLTVEESAEGIIDVIAGLESADSGKFYKWNGEIHPW